MPPELAVVGSINLDLVARVERLPQAGETVSGASFERVPGGKGANQALAAARLGADVTLLGAVGDDPFAQEALAMLEEEVDLDLERRGMTGVALILVDAAGDNQIVVIPGANAELGPVVVTVPEAVLCQLEIPLEIVEMQAEFAKFFCLNASPARRIPKKLVKQCDLVVVNRFELDSLPTTPRLTALTLGAEGALLLEEGKEVVRATPPKVNAVDGTGAGDAFCACLVVSFLEGLDREEALRRACAAGAIAASRFGAQPSLPTADEVDEILRA